MTPLLPRGATCALHASRLALCSRSARGLSQSATSSSSATAVAAAAQEPQQQGTSGAKFLYALPVKPDGKAVADSSEWDDYPLWVATFAARGSGVWQSTEAREVQEFGLEFRSANPNGPVLRRFDEPTRSAFHNKVRLFSRLVAARVACTPPTVFTATEARKAMTASPPGTVWFYKKAKGSRGRGVFPITTLDQLPPEELAEVEAANAAAAAAAACTDSPPPSATPSATPARSAPAPAPGASAAALPTADSGGIFQQQVPNMLLYDGGRKHDLRVLVVMGPGRRAWVHRTFYMRVASDPLRAGDLSRGAQLTNISQGAAVLAVQGPYDMPQYDTVLRNVLATTHSVISAMCDVLPAEGAMHYFGFDYMLDRQLQPWLLEVNSTPRLINCNKPGGAVHVALLELLTDIVEPTLQGKAIEEEASEVGDWVPVYP